MTRLYVVEQSGIEPGGHYYSYTSCVVEGARQLGLDPVVLANKRFRASAAAGEFDVIPAFTYTWVEAERAGTLAWGEGNIAYEIFAAFARVPPAAEDHVFLHTLGCQELAAILSALTRRLLPGDPIPYFHILLRRDPAELFADYRPYADHFGQIAASPFLRRKLLLHADTQQLSEAFAALTGLPVATAPIPLDRGLLREALSARAPRRRGAPLTVAYLGDAREEKGFQLLPQALTYLWPDYIAKGRVRFLLQSNFNTPGGEAGILAAAQALAGFPGTTLYSDPVSPAEYFRLLAAADIVLIPYSAERYRYRSSGVLVEAMAAGKVVVTSAGSWMARQVTPEHAVLFDAPTGLGPAIGAAVDRFAELSAGAAARRGAALAQATGADLVRHLLSRVEPVAEPGANRRRILLVISGDALVARDGAALVAQAQLQYLTAAGYDVIGLCLNDGMPLHDEAIAEWRATLGRSLARFPLERVFVAGPGGRSLDPAHLPATRDAQRREGGPLKAEFDYAAGFAFGGALLKFLRAHPVDAVLLNRVTNFPVIDALGLDGVPVICEIDELQALQRAVGGRRLVNEADLDEEFAWLSRCAALIALDRRTAMIARDRLREIRIETAGMVLPAPPAPLASLAGAKDLAEIVSSTIPQLPEYRCEMAPEIGDGAARKQLNEAGFLDLLYVGSLNPADVAGLRWFLSQVYEPYLAHRGVTMIVAGEVSRAEGWPQHKRLFLVGRVEEAAPLYAAARIVVLPIVEGAGCPIRTFEALAHGRPLIGTSHAFAGVAETVGEEFLVRDDPAAFAEAVIGLRDSPAARQRAAERSRHAARRLNDFARYFAVMDRLLGQTLDDERPPTPPPAPLASAEEPYVEWSRGLQALNRALRCYLDGDPLEGEALDILAEEEPTQVKTLLDAVSRSLLVDRDAAVLRSEPRLNRYLANPPDSRRREDAMFAVMLALAGRYGTPTQAAAAAARVVVYGGLPMTVAGIVTAPGEGQPTIVVDGRVVATRRIADSRRRLGRGGLFQAKIPARNGDNGGLRTIELAVRDDDGDGDNPAGGAIAVLCHSIPMSAETRLFRRPVFDDGFDVASDGAGFELAPGSVGVLTLPRIVNGHNPAYVDLCFACPERDDAGSPAAPPFPALTVTVDGGPIDPEFVGAGAVTLVRIMLGEPGAVGDFGIVRVRIGNNDARFTPRLVTVSTGLFLGPLAATAGIATILALSESPLGQARGSRPAAAGRQAIAAIIEGRPLDAAHLGALCALAVSAGGPERLATLAAQELPRALHDDSIARTLPGDTDAALDDIYAIVGSCLGTSDPAIAILSPALPFEIVDRQGRTQAVETQAARKHRGGSWRVAMPPAGSGETIRIRLDATLEIANRPGIIGYSNFYPVESPGALFRWTGPETISTITIPVALNHPARLLVELGATGKNVAPDDFAISCGGKAVPHTLQSDGETVTLSAFLPAAQLAGPSLEIGLAVRESFQQPPDRRELGVVFAALLLNLGADDDAAMDARPRPAACRPYQPPDGQASGRKISPDGARRALVIDDSVPEPDKDAGSNAVLQHMLSLQRLGYRVSFVPADNMARIDPYTADLERRGIECRHRPHDASVDDVLANTAPFDLVYLHRHSNAFKHGAAVRAHSPAARLIYCVADLHFLRLQRQAEVEGGQALRDAAGEMRSAELAAMGLADRIIVHSPAEAELLKQLSADIAVQVVPWTIEPREIAGASATEPALAFIGGYRHHPNVDAARWAAHGVMPLLRTELPGIKLLLVGSHMPAEVAALAAPDVLPLGHVAALDDVFARVRLTIAPLRFGAGLKGKVLDSLAAGIPCVMTSVAAEGLNLPPELQSLVADEPAEIARRIAALWRDGRAYRRTARAARAYIAANYSAARIDALMREACGLPSTGAAPRRARKPAPNRPAQQTV